MPPKKPFFIQLSDTHLFEDPAARLWDVEPDAMLDRTLDMLCVTAPNPDFVLVTGDCSSDGSEHSYVRLEEKLRRLAAPLHYLPGNHDDTALMARLFLARQIEPHQKLMHSFEAHGWHFILLDSAVPGEDWGLIGRSQLHWLQENLAAPIMPTIVAVHHN
ncbi:MAG: metallophosphoesterase, partial [Candidatus Eremiobacteraeota bacterium]|nr:metallophosphoesterase [Candidatus Eremiobacteraeota bacterium]